jgi:hypothetical protein
VRERSTVFILVRPGDVGLGFVRPPPGISLLVFRRWPDGTAAVDDFPETTDVREALVPHLDARAVRLERGRLYVTAANGYAVYMPVGPCGLASGAWLTRGRPKCPADDPTHLHRRSTDGHRAQA